MFLRITSLHSESLLSFKNKKKSGDVISLLLSSEEIFIVILLLVFIPSNSTFMKILESVIRMWTEENCRTVF